MFANLQKYDPNNDAWCYGGDVKLEQSSDLHGVIR